MRKSNYDKFPSTKISGNILKEWSAIITALQQILNDSSIVVVDMYVGVHEEEVISELKRMSPDLLLNTRNLFKSEAEILDMTKRFMTDDTLFGYVTNLEMADYFDPIKLQQAKKNIESCLGKVIVIGCGASLVVPECSTIIYLDMARREIQQRFRRHEVLALGVDNRYDDFSLQYKRGFFNDWRVCDKYKDKLFNKISFWIDTHVACEPKMINKETFFMAINQIIKSPFRVVPFFDPAPWGGQWMKNVCDLDKSSINYGWCFDCVPEENSLLLDVNGTLFEMPSVNLVLLKSRDLLGEPVEARFGKEFPIRFDFLDTMQGGNLSLQVHPTAQYIREKFGMQYTQDESYYMLDVADGAVVYLGLKSNIDKNQMIEDLLSAQKENTIFDVDKYVNKIPAKKHDHFLIPGGTIHCSGAQGMVLEISATPNLFTFKLWDWQKLGLDGKPRPVNIERGKLVIDWRRDTEYVYKQLFNIFSIVKEGDGCKEEKTGLHPNEFIETRRHRFISKVIHYTNNSVNVLNLVEGDEIVVESPTYAFEPFLVHYAETFIIPAAIGEYTISPAGKSVGKECVTIKAYVRF